MTIGIRWGEDLTDDLGGFIYLDAVTAYTQNFKGQVTKHPIANGGNVSDHFIRDNPVITLSGVITGVDISTGVYLVQSFDGVEPVNTFPAPSAVSVNSTDQSVLQKFIPDSIGQFLGNATPNVVVDARRADLLDQIKQALTSLATGDAYNSNTGQYTPSIQLVRLYEFDKANVKKIINRLVITNVTFKEDANSGYALYCDITFEQVTFANLKKTTIPKDVVNSLKKKGAVKADKGKQDSTPQTIGSGSEDEPKDTDPLRQAREN